MFAVDVPELPDLASRSPLWLALATVLLNAVVGALRATTDPDREWDIVGMTAFALLMGLGGGFIRDALTGDLPAATLREPWYLVTVVVGVVIVRWGGRWIVHNHPLLVLLNALALGLFSISGAARALDLELPVVSAVLIGTLTAVGGGVLVAVLQGQIPTILLAGTPNALLAVLGAVVYVAVDVASAVVASFAAVAAVVVAQFLVDHFDVRTRPTGAARRR